MNSNPSRGQGQQQPPDPQRSGEGLNPSVPGEGSEGRSQERGDSNRAPRQQHQPGRPPQRQQGNATGGASQPGSLKDDEDDEDVDTRPNADVGNDPNATTRT